MPDTVQSRLKERRKHVRRGEGTRAEIGSGGGVQPQMRPEDIGAVSAAPERQRASTPTSALLSPQQFSVFGRSLTEEETIRFGSAARPGFMPSWFPEGSHAQRAFVPPFTTSPVVPAEASDPNERLLKPEKVR